MKRFPGQYEYIEVETWVAEVSRASTVRNFTIYDKNDEIIGSACSVWVMLPKVSIIMGSTSDLPVMEKAAILLNEFEIPFEINALSAHRTPKEVEQFATQAQERGIKVIIAAAGMAAHLPGVIASMKRLIPKK